MNKTIILLIKCLLITVAFFLFANLIAFLFHFLQSTNPEQWSFRFKHGMFYLNGKETGMMLGSAKANGFMILIFVLSYFTLAKIQKSKQDTSLELD